ncbi:rod shape-determining protein MreD [Paenibacillus apiarius]|uniref:Rod shape-determining protein MreD n=1 Tax=Paenibacillus apiarius TaxID=46240 RepID=A0ABT4DYW1_9BACL|nr:rod shape-determining protein MreD [Paenibacillus apiarius]MBN3525660.1 rod shape-determining protein MreD [Paenibacillus apiarius]MCY9516543.1 rod shape-determining protein MreD [Paenibacillus apiarius]MCY9522534.1 rod shape-determining protein MreD [Paenibacillus apiarius]MCY9554542.1 rod shape-determining protein MreD [Paenibacillus apiarius]MCY9556658.1 rod shape-determining protein MreD [Paenibacillus apiarius]
MNRNWMIGFMFILFLLEGTVMPVLIPDAWQGRIVPQFVFMVILYHAVYQHRHTSLLMGLGFGFLQDIVYYGHMIGPHAFSMGLLGYLVGLLFTSRNATLFTMMAIAVFGSFAHQTILFAVYSLFGINHMTYEYALFDFMIPSLFVQLVFALAIYVPMRTWFDRLSGKASAEDEQG